MLFWRAKTAKSATDQATPATDETTTSQKVSHDAAGLSDGVNSKATDDDTNVVKLAPTRLKDRLADVSIKTKADDVIVSAIELRTKTEIDVGAAAAVLGQSKALSDLGTALSDGNARAHVLVIGPVGTGRRTAVRKLAEEAARTQPSLPDWVYVLESNFRGSHPNSVMQAFPVKHGEGHRLVRDIKSALAKSSAMLDRLIASDDHQMNLALLEDDHRHRNDNPLDHLKRRAEAQNIALVKTLEGYVLAPMHEGKVVRAEVFRALPEALQRDVEAKIAALEIELQSLLVALPGNDSATDDRLSALSHQTAERAAKPNLAVARKLFRCDDGGAPVFDMIESAWIERATDQVRTSSKSGGSDRIFLQSIGTEEAERAPVVIARTCAPTDLLGEIGRDGHGELAIRPGHLSKANGGFLIVEAWRLAAQPSSWMALSAALETGALSPMPSAGVAVTADAVPLQVKIIVVADEVSWAKLKALDPGISRHFPRVIRFSASAPLSDVTENNFVSWTGSLAETSGLRPLEKSAGELLYSDAKERAKSSGQVSLDIATLVQILREADTLAADASSDRVRFSDVRTAIKYSKESDVT